MTIWFTSDLHFGHANIIKYCRRPFGGVDEMDYALIQNWNERVTEDDYVYVLGDFSFHRRERTTQILRSLRGKKILLPGNHDGAWLSKTGGWEGLLSQGDLVTLPVVHTLVCGWIASFGYCPCSVRARVSHYPPNHASLPSEYFLHGHSHGTKAITAPGVYDVGVDANNYAPVRWEDISTALARELR